MLWGLAFIRVVWAAWEEPAAAWAALWHFQHSLHRFFWPLLLSVPGSSAASRVLPAPAILPTAASSTADGLTFLEIDAKGGEGALECLDLWELMDFSWRSFAFGFRLLLMFICVELLLYIFMICVLHELGLRLVFGFEHLVCNVWWTMLVCVTLIYLCSSCGCEVVLTKLKFISYISCILYASISTCRENSVKSFK